MPRARATPPARPEPAARPARSTAARVLPWLVLGVVFLILLRVLAGLGGASTGEGPAAASDRLFHVLALLATAGAPPAVYLLASVGLGRLARPLFRAADDPLALQAGLGLSFHLTLSHLLGITGLLAGTTGRAITIALAAAGLLLLADQLRRAWRTAPVAPPTDRWARPLSLIIPSIGAAILLLAACSPPGWLWDSEFGGYDALSYHLQLPQEWLVSGRVWPVEHNIYSYLPGYLESAFVHLAAMTGAPAAFQPDGAPFGLLSGDGSRAISCQLLPAGLALIAAWTTARWTGRGLARLGFQDRATASGAFAAGTLVILTPWVQVTGSLAYNEMGVLALFAAALIAAADRSLAPVVRTGLAAWLTGVACGLKPTALLFCAPPIALILAVTVPPRSWWKLAAPGILAGAAALAPWLIRNALASGNPVFPAMTGLFGTGHWTAEQAERFTQGHQFRGTLADALRLLILPDPSDPAGTRHRGLLHPQWGLFLPIIAIAAAATLAMPRTRRAGAVLTGALLLQLLAWLFATHLQSRFLLPMLIPGAALAALALAPLYEHARAAFKDLAARREAGPRAPSARTQLLILAVMFAPAPIWVQGALAWRNFALQQRDTDADGKPVGPGHPNAALLAGPGVYSGDSLRAARDLLPPDQWAAALSTGPVLFLNLQPPGEPVLLVGEAAPFYYTIPLRYSTTWDTSPLARAIREHPDDPGAWAGAIFPGGRGLVLIHFGELERLQRSGWLDPTLDPQRLADWVQAEGRIIQSWPGVALVSVSAGPPLPSPAPTPTPNPAP